MNELALFAGAGGGILGGKLLRWNTIGAVEIEGYPRKTLLQRQRDGILNKFPIWDDITTFDGRPWNGAVDIISGGFPCQDISAAGKGEGIDGERSGLWKQMRRVADEIRPQFIFVENSPMLTSRGLGTVLGDLAEMGYNARWCVLGADDAGAPHRRKRIWILAYTNKMRELQPKRVKQNERGRVSNSCEICNPSESGFPHRGGASMERSEEISKFKRSGCIDWWLQDPAEIPDTDELNGNLCGYGTSEICGEQSGQAKISGCEIPNSSSFGPSGQGMHGRSGNKETDKNRETDRTINPRENKKTKWHFKSRVDRVAHGVANRVDRLKAIGNGQVPATHAIAFTILSEGLI